MKPNITRNILLILLAFLGLGAIGGGGALIISPSGDLLKMPVSLLEKSPFNNFLVPGIILFSILGLVPIMLIFALLKRPECKLAEKLNFFKDMHWSLTYTVYVAFALIIWIQIEMVFLGAVGWLHTFYMFFALSLFLWHCCLKSETYIKSK